MGRDGSPSRPMIETIVFGALGEIASIRKKILKTSDIETTIKR
ncbi:MAG: hypothetical protein WCR55_13090 [Lentisphaerota bacterium]